MRVLRRDVNNSLLMLIAFFLVLFIGFTMYYASVLRKVSGEKDQNDRIISEITANMVLEKLNSSEKSGQLAMIDKAVLEDKYTKLEAHAKGLELEKERLEQEIIVMKSKKEYSDSRVDGPVGQFRVIQSKNEEIKKLTDKIQLLCAIFSKNNITASECRNVNSDTKE